MGGATIPWFVLVAFLTYQHGFKQGKLPEPHYYIGATAAMSIAALVGTVNRNVGTLFAWALFLGVVLKAATDQKLFITANSEKAPGKKDQTSTKPNGPSPNPTAKPQPTHLFI